MIKIDIAKPADKSVLYDIERRVFVPSDGKLSKSSFAYHIRNNMLLTCKLGTTIVGYILVLCPKKNKAQEYIL